MSNGQPVMWVMKLTEEILPKAVPALQPRVVQEGTIIKRVGGVYLWQASGGKSKRNAAALSSLSTLRVGMHVQVALAPAGETDTIIARTPYPAAHRSNNCSVPEQHSEDACPWESSAARRARVIQWACDESGLTDSMWLGMMYIKRRPSYGHKFYAFLREWGGVEFDADGSVIESSRGKGPDYDQFLRDTPTDRHAQRKIRESLRGGKSAAATA